MKTIKIDELEYLDFTKEQHIKKHTKRENTHCNECPYCESKKW